MRSSNSVERYRTPDAAEVKAVDGRPSLAPLLAGVVEHKRWTTFRQRFDQALDELKDALDDIAQDERFREAITWQNRGALETISKLPKHSNVRNSWTRQTQELVARYWQRYCTKNDTIGFFGPIAWATLTPMGPSIRVEPGPYLLARRTTYFEKWAIDSVAETIAKNPLIVPWLVPRVQPHKYVTNRHVSDPYGAPLQLDELEAAVVAMCDGSRTVRVICKELSVSAGLSEADLHSLIRQLRDRGVLSWKLEVPWTACPDKWLLKTLTTIEDENVRSLSLAPLLALERDRAAVAKAAGNASQLSKALAQLETTFIEVTDSSPEQSGGLLFAGVVETLPLSLGLACCIPSAQPWTYSLPAPAGLPSRQARLTAKPLREFMENSSKKVNRQ